MPVEPQDRCQAMTAKGQCNYAKVPETDYCAGHAGRHRIMDILKKDKAAYQLLKYGARVTELTTVGKAHKSLHEEVAILRLSLEKAINRCNDDDLFIASAPIIGDLVMKIKAALEAAHKLDQDEKRLLSKEQLIVVASSILDIICAYVEDSQAREEIAEKIAILLEEKS